MIFLHIAKCVADGVNSNHKSDIRVGQTDYPVNCYRKNIDRLIKKNFNQVHKKSEKQK